MAYDASDIRTVHALILGPPETPYQFGFFEVRIRALDTTIEDITTLVPLTCEKLP